MAKPYLHLFASLALLALCAACTGMSPDRYAQGELVCNDAKACDAMWSAAESWIRQNSVLALAEHNDLMLETRCGREAESVPCYTLMRQPQRSGETRIHIYIACGNDFIGCDEPATRMRNQLRAAMESASGAPGTASYTR